MPEEKQEPKQEKEKETGGSKTLIDRLGIGTITGLLTELIAPGSGLVTKLGAAAIYGGIASPIADKIVYPKEKWFSLSRIYDALGFYGGQYIPSLVKSLI